MTNLKFHFKCTVGKEIETNSEANNSERLNEVESFINFRLIKLTFTYFKYSYRFVALPLSRNRNARHVGEIRQQQQQF